MATLYLLPNWFFTYSVIFEIIFALITGFVAFYAFKVYLLCKQNESKLLSMGFAFISASYILWAIVNLSLIDRLSSGISAVELSNIVSLGMIGVYTHIFLFIIGLLTVTYTNLKVNNAKVYSLILLLSILALFMTDSKGSAYYILATIFFGYIAATHLSSYIKNRNSKSLIILIAFALLFISHIYFIFAARSYMYYVIGHSVSLAGYILILFGLILIIKNEQKKKSPRSNKRYSSSHK